MDAEPRPQRRTQTSVSATSPTSLAIFRGKNGRTLVVGATNREQETRLFLRHALSLRGCRSLVVYRSNAVESYSIEKDASRLDWRTILEIGPVVSLLTLVAPIVVAPTLVRTEEAASLPQLVEAVEGALQTDILLLRRLRRTPDLWARIKRARDVSELCRLLNR